VITEELLHLFRLNCVPNVVQNSLPADPGSEGSQSDFVVQHGLGPKPMAPHFGATTALCYIENSSSRIGCDSNSGAYEPGERPATIPAVTDSRGGQR